MPDCEMMKEQKWIQLPREMTKDSEAIKVVIKSLQILLKVNKGKYVTSLKGFRNKFLYYFCGYIYLPRNPPSPFLRRREGIVDVLLEVLKQPATKKG